MQSLKKQTIPFSVALLSFKMKRPGESWQVNRSTYSVYLPFRSNTYLSSLKNANFAIIIMAFRHRTKRDRQRYCTPRNITTLGKNGGVVKYYRCIKNVLNVTKSKLLPSYYLSHGEKVGESRVFGHNISICTNSASPISLASAYVAQPRPNHFKTKRFGITPNEIN